ncbi:MAG: rod shape-determining protein MreC [Deltaproteobacteria bacterium RIFCSPLOWO2_01_44_7]|nr:MAG: rod shape-determining protein MreC [Deltaproteobacteria bacterium RIFCSPHIGHO2_01_FULL_43_49]OGQ14234.1 MAG: rod shape-determining protein MreC [Deltaproteobacteria bacterium RIFCSPHIGHO2_02_FULL_44_53]OGQ27450.1 MAG: rod shape-determining protein MreC [Deltaproteobacteria bacterium RIFCSPHIGHO2_12_FULL_44_21]OGQ30698.1 MAG: rod shape-determining protein MreC [Deltaproteobacteria bacterium RIFCSPLOWO2_01_FULL_45_74]OGQ41426.1 MAG: rod shape-determining protein MreC [Deltaproteobacteria 
MNKNLRPVWQYLIPIILTLFFLSLLSTRTHRALWYEQWALNLISPVTSVLSWSKNQVADHWKHYLYLVGAGKRNIALENELKILRQKVVTFDELVFENQRLNDVLSLKQNSWPDSIAAKIIGYDPRSEYKSIKINKGSSQGVKTDMPVVAMDGLVGKVGPVFSNEAIVLLVIDPASSVDVIVERSRVRGLLVGMAKDTELRPGYFLTRLEYLNRTSDLQISDVVITSGLDQLFPKGLLVGTVETISNNRFGIFLDADVVPTVDFSKLEEVLVLKYP